MLHVKVDHSDLDHEVVESLGIEFVAMLALVLVSSRNTPSRHAPVFHNEHKILQEVIDKVLYERLHIYCIELQVLELVDCRDIHSILMGKVLGS
jgi:hypothetical protein